nr:hypothetical protein RSP673_05475 [Ralstonia solanacearum P673]
MSFQSRILLADRGVFDACIGSVLRVSTESHHIEIPHR